MLQSASQPTALKDIASGMCYSTVDEAVLTSSNRCEMRNSSARTARMWVGRASHHGTPRREDLPTQRKFTAKIHDTRRDLQYRWLQPTTVAWGDTTSPCDALAAPTTYTYHLPSAFPPSTNMTHHTTPHSFLTQPAATASASPLISPSMSRTPQQSCRYVILLVLVTCQSFSAAMPRNCVVAHHQQCQC